MDEELLALKRSRNYHDFFSKAVFYKKNIVVSGATGSGKTTFMKSLVTHIPEDERLITIEDARELFIEQPNRVHLIYSRGGQGTANVTAKGCMEACLRMKPDPHHPGRNPGRRIVLLHPQLRLRPPGFDHQLPCRQHEPDLGPDGADGQGLA